MGTLRGGRMYRVTGASSQTGAEVEITVQAYDEADAARAANRQGIFVSACVAADADPSKQAGYAAPAAPAAAAPPAAAAVPEMTFPEAVARHPVVQRLVRAHPELADRVKRLNEEDRAFLSALVGEEMGISYRDSSDMGRLMKRADTWNQP